MAFCGHRRCRFNPHITGDPDYYLMQRIWVEAQIGDTWYVFDPAFKTYQSFQRPNLQAAMGYTESAFLASAMAGATVTADYVRHVNEVHIGTTLTAYATNLVCFIQTHNALMSVEELIDGRKMLPETLPHYPTSLPKAILIEAGTSDTWDHIPATNHVVLTLRHGGSVLRRSKATRSPVNAFHSTTISLTAIGPRCG